MIQTNEMTEMTLELAVKDLKAFFDHFAFYAWGEMEGELVDKAKEALEYLLAQSEQGQGTSEDPVD